MFVNASKNKENYEERRLKKAASIEEDNVFKGREFGKELTNKADSTTDEESNDKASIHTDESAYESQIPHFSCKSYKLGENGTEIPLVKTKPQKVSNECKITMVLLQVHKIVDLNKNFANIAFINFKLT